jgi:UTP--glucose-1-phosphate uridylyltransferase
MPSKPSKIPPSLEKILTKKELDFLKRYKFDFSLWHSFQNTIKTQGYNKNLTQIKGKLDIPLEDQIIKLEHIPTEKKKELFSLGQEAIRRSQLGIIILNGGMATRFGGVVKGLYKVIDKKSFLELKLKEVNLSSCKYKGTISVYIMNSFLTDASTREFLLKNDFFGYPRAYISYFTQAISIRLTPKGEVFEGKSRLYTPGHGDFVEALLESGCLEEFINKGGRYLMMSNIDNLGATIDPVILGLHIQHQKEMSVEVVRYKEGDTGGAPLIIDGKLQLVEGFRLPQSLKSIPYFNTNTFIFDASSLQRSFTFTYFPVKKKVEGRDVIQFERIAGELSRFLQTQYICVPRQGKGNRYLPIKDVDELKRRLPEIRQVIKARFGE